MSCPAHLTTTTRNLATVIPPITDLSTDKQIFNLSPHLKNKIINQLNASDSALVTKKNLADSFLANPAPYLNILINNFEEVFFSYDNFALLLLASPSKVVGQECLAKIEKKITVDRSSWRSGEEQSENVSFLTFLAFYNAPHAYLRLLSFSQSARRDFNYDLLETWLSGMALANFTGGRPFPHSQLLKDFTQQAWQKWQTKKDLFTETGTVGLVLGMCSYFPEKSRKILETFFSQCSFKNHPEPLFFPLLDQLADANYLHGNLILKEWFQRNYLDFLTTVEDTTFLNSAIYCLKLLLKNKVKISDDFFPTLEETKATPAKIKTNALLKSLVVLIQQSTDPQNQELEATFYQIFLAADFTETKEKSLPNYNAFAELLQLLPPSRLPN